MEIRMSTPYFLEDAESRSISSTGRIPSISRQENRHDHHVEESKRDHSDTHMLNGQESSMITARNSRHIRAIHAWYRFAIDRWIWEWCAMLISGISLIAIFLILQLHQGRPLPNWPYSITINSLISIFATIFKVTILVPIAQGLSQAKRHWFQRCRPMIDMDTYDQASREPWGALKFLWAIRWR